MAAHTIHDFHAAAKHVASHKNPHDRATATFDMIHGQIVHSLDEAKAAPDKDAAIKVFEDNAKAAFAHRAEIIATLAS